METVVSKHSLSYVILASLIAGIAGILFGYDTGVISGALVFLQKDFVLNTTQEGLVVSLLLFGAAIGALGVGKFADSLGRKRSLILSSICFILGSIGLTYASSINDLYIYRFIIGLSIGIASFSAPSYISEIAPANLRGRLVSLFQLSIAVGILITYIVNQLLANTQSPWRGMFFCGAIPAIILLIGIFFMPDSPRWLLLKHKDDEAIRALKKLRGIDNYQIELAEIKLNVEAERARKSNWRNLFNAKNIPIIAIAVLVMFFQQLCGINAILYYAPKVFIYAGFGVANSLFNTVLIGVVFVISTIIGLVFLDKLGRRPLMIFGCALMAVAQATVAIVFHENMSQLEAYIGVISILIYIFAFSISLGLLGWLIIAEIFPLNVRGEGASIGATANWIFNISVSFSFPVLLPIVGINLIFGFFSFICILGTIYCIKYLPETSGVSLEVIEANLNDGNRSRDLGASRKVII